MMIGALKPFLRKIEHGFTAVDVRQADITNIDSHCSPHLWYALGLKHQVRVQRDYRHSLVMNSLSRERSVPIRFSPANSGRSLLFRASRLENKHGRAN
jgi:hypothetical protein